MARASDAVRDPAAPLRIGASLAAVVLLVPLLVVAQVRPWVLFDADSLASTGRFLSGFVPPRVDAAFVGEALRAAWVTVAIATVGLALALAMATPLALVATRRLSVSAIGRARPGVAARVVRGGLRALLVTLRSVPEVVLALLFVRVTGLGPTAGVLAIAIAYGAMLAKVFCDIVESNDDAAAAALLANGSGRLAAFVYGTLPQCASELSSYLVYRWECAVRASVVMGFVGAGGLGQATDTAMKMMAGNEVATLLVAFMLLVWVADLISASVRRLLDAPARRPRASHAVVGAARQRWPGALFAIAVITVLVASVLSLRLSFGDFAEPDAGAKMLAFLRGFVPPDGSPRVLERLATGTAETIAMSLVGTLAAAIVGGVVALPASRPSGPVRGVARLALNFLRAVPELVWAALLVIAVGLGPFAGTLALALHTTGVLGRLFADTLENLPPGPAAALRDNGSGGVAVFLYARLPQALPQFASYVLYRWENNIRAATVLGVVGAGGLGQMLFYALSLFRMRQAASVVLAMIAIVLVVDGLSHWLRARMSY